MSSQEKKIVWEDTGYLPKSLRLYRKESVCATEPGWAGSTAGPDRAVNAALPGLNSSNSIVTFEDVGHRCQTQRTQMSVTTVALHISVSPDAVVCTKQTLKPLWVPRTINLSCTGQCRWNTDEVTFPTGSGLIKKKVNFVLTCNGGPIKVDLWSRTRDDRPCGLGCQHAFQP